MGLVSSTKVAPQRPLTLRLVCFACGYRCCSPGVNITGITWVLVEVFLIHTPCRVLLLNCSLNSDSNNGICTRIESCFCSIAVTAIFSDALRMYHIGLPFLYCIDTLKSMV